MMSAGSTHPESAQAEGESTRCRNLVAVASCSPVEVEVVGLKRHSAK